MKISIIIPIFAVEKYIRECVDSVLGQSYSEIEVVLVDDGSQDKSPQICDEYLLKNTNVKVIHKENGGLSDSRNVGVQNATGEYVLFLDGDDFFEDSYAIERLVNRVSISKAEVLNFSYIKYYDDIKKQEPYFYDKPSMPLGLTKKEQIKYLIENNLYIASACNKMVKRKLLDDLKFEKGVYSEDIEWCAKLLLKAKSLDFVCENFYCYRQRSGSISHSINDKKCFDLCLNIIKSIKVAESSTEDLKLLLYGYASYQYGTFFKVQAMAENIQDNCFAELKEYQWILSYHYGNKKLYILNLGCKVFGYINICKFIRYVFLLRKGRKR
ncbi:MAG: glycosyltransferase family 2 protein [Erysipelotrichaceae bacterium]|nr:glycosyltransferase family 2 protein [Erysipelotrichaceae bacterium]